MTDFAQQPGSPLRGLLIAQFLGAFNDNAFKLVAAFLAIAGVQELVAPGAEQEAAAQTATTIAFVTFTLPLMLVSLPAALWVDRFSKRSVLVVMKSVEVALMALGTWALALGDGGGVAILVVLAAMGAQSAVFSPAKYGILPEILPPDRLVAGNGRLESWTMVSIIAGTAAAGVMLDVTGDATWIIGACLTALSAVGLLAIRSVPHVQPAGSATGVRDAFGGAWRAVRAERTLWLASIGSVVFWGIASLVTQNALVFGKTVLDLAPQRASLPLAASGVGIGLGAWIVGRMTRTRMELGWIPLGAVGLAGSLAALGFGDLGFHGTVVWMFAVGVFSGWVVVPLNSLLQLHTPADRRGAVIALVNAASFGGILAGTLGCDALARAGVSATGIFVSAALVAAVATVWALWLLPQAGVRLILLILTHTLYRLRIVGGSNVPAEGPALLVCNHVSFVDGLLLSAGTDREIRFLVEESYYNKPLLRPFMKLFGFVPIAQTAPPRELLQSIRRAGEALDAGEVVCIFAEGEITRTGQILPFRRGFQRILKGRDVPVVPVHLDRVWGSLTSFARGSWMRLLTSIPRRITVSFGTQQPASITAPELHATVRQLESHAWCDRIAECGPLHRPFVSATRRAPWRFAAAQEERGTRSRLGLLTSAVAMARALRPQWQDQARVGVLLPPSIAGAVVNLAASLSGRAVVNLNFTTGADAMASAARQADLRTVITSKAFLEKADVEVPAGVEPIWIEDVAAHIGKPAKLLAAGAAMFLPQSALERFCGAKRPIEATDTATVIFSSGSTGEPKGVILRHCNIRANVESVTQALPLQRDDRLLGSLPLFHSFGTMGLWFALQSGLGIVFQPNPLDAPTVGRLVARFRLTMLIATPTFLQVYTRRCEPGQFGSLRLVVVGAEKLPARIADAFEERFGVRPLEGYGATECAPVVAVNTPGYRAKGFYQAGSRRGTVGQPLPGVAVRVVDPDTRAPVPVGESGLLEVFGPNVMEGYLGRDDLTAEALREGWYSTGDIAQLDEDGYVTITDRLSRFSKIAGEMVPHGKVETALHEAADSIDQVFAVTGIPCEKKGEQLVVLHTLDDARIAAVLERLEQSGLPNLFRPRKDAFVHVEALPILGTGKLDLRGVRAVAQERLGAAPSPS